MESELQPPISFPFPFEPYGIQKDFMRELYLTLERGQVGIFESPTGTGKSLSIICGALKWLLDREERDKEEIAAVLEGKLSASALKTSTSRQEASAGMASGSGAAPKDEPDWFAAYDKKKEERELVERLKEEVKRKEERDARLKKLREEQKSSRWQVKRKRDASPVPTEDVTLGVEDDTDLVVAEYISDEEGKEAENIKSSDSEEDVEEDNIRKIYYCSRTHTQLAQFVREVQKSVYGDSIQLITLGSRQNLCINPEVMQLKSITAMNDRCLEMQKSKRKKAVKMEKQRTSEGQAKNKQRRKRSTPSAHCPFYKAGALGTFRDMALAKVQDIEQLVSVGKNMSACPYYGTRQAVPAAQLVVLPYNTLLHAPTRDAVGIKLKGNVVIIDEAHNLMDTISNVYSIQIKGTHVTKTHSQLSQYMDRYRSRLKAKNLMYINQILQVLKCFITLLQTKPQGVGTELKLVRLNDFLFTSNIDNVNIFKILRYCEKSQISRKLNGFVDRYSESSCELVQGGQKEGEGEGEGHRPQMNSPLMLIEGFLQALTNTDTDGRIVINRSETVSSSSLKFLLLNPSVHFTRVVKEASAVIVAGGTMQPADEFKDQLLTQAGLGPAGIVEFTCGHVIPPDHLLPLVFCKGPSGENLEFSYRTRERENTIDELGRVLINLSSIVPGGVVCFFPSYEYEKKVCSHWEQNGVLNKIEKKKKVFREPKLSSMVEPVLSQYGKHIERCLSREEHRRSEGTGGDGGGSDVGHTTGAILFSVVGGKLSEGINFSDDLGRCIVMVGLPYPNIASPELKEKMEYLNTTMPRSSDGRLPGQVHYESLCMKAVNQSIGRAIRHSRDYACIVFTDLRYERKNVTSQLPQWISSQLNVCKTFGPGFATIRKFFNTKRTQ